MLYMYQTINKRVYNFTNLHENVELVIYGVLGFFVPLLFGHPQLLVGSIVNSLIVISALHHRGFKPFTLFVLPSIGALTRGILFGPFTIFLVYMLPFIWFSNFILWVLIKKIYIEKKKNYIIASFISSISKALFLFIIAFILFKFNVIPKLFLIAMGPIQLATAIIGTFIGGGVSKIMVSFKKNIN